MHCPKCGKDGHKVIESRSSEGGNSVRRRRKCDDCGHRWTTYERNEEGYELWKENTLNKMRDLLKAEVAAELLESLQQTYEVELVERKRSKPRKVEEFRTPEYAHLPISVAIKAAMTAKGIRQIEAMVHELYAPASDAEFFNARQSIATAIAWDAELAYRGGCCEWAEEIA